MRTGVVYKGRAVFLTGRGVGAVASIGDLDSGGRVISLDRSRSLDRFLAAVERRAFRIAHIATGDVDEAMDLLRAECRHL